MVEEVTLITYSEIGLKSPPVRRNLENLLARHIRIFLKRSGLEKAKVTRMQGRLLIRDADSTTTAEIASKVFGVASAIPATKITSNLNEVTQTASEVAMKNIINGKTFAVRARRIGEQPYRGRDIEVKVGAEILANMKSRDIKVNLKKPDVTIFIEARNDDAYVYHRIIEGPSGLPYGSQGKLISLFSGGIDSPVAAWFMMKRGADVRLLFLDQRPFVGEDYFDRTIKVAGKLGEYVPLKSYRIYIAPVGEIMEEIVKNISSRFTCVICKRIMYRIACRVAEMNRADGIVTGENLGQVASQTLANLKVLDEASTLPVYRPLIGFEKMDIVELAKKIGTYEYSISRIHGCTAVPSKPATRAKIEDVLESETKIPVDKLVTKSLEGITTISVTQ